MIELQGTPDGSITQTFGGDTLNTAVYLARLGSPFGVQAEYISALGDDKFSESMLRFWHHEGVLSSLVRRLPGRLPGLYFIDLEPDGERVFSYWRGEAAARDCFTLPGAAPVLQGLEDFDAIYLSGISLGILREAGRALLLERLRELRRRGVRIFFDCNFRPRLWGEDEQSARESARVWYRQSMELCHVALLTAEEAPVLDASFLPESRELCSAVAALGPEEVIVKNGGGECFVRQGGTTFTVAAQRLDHVVDTTAAGDSFSAAYLLGRRLGLDAPESVRRAHRLAARVISHRGAIIPGEAMPALFADLLHCKA